jgi:hypothetical protein
MSSWFSAALLFEAEVGGECAADSLCEVSIRLLSAANLELAKERAAALGRDGEHGYTNASGEQVVWRFRGVLEVQELEGGVLEDGVEVFSRMFTKDDASDARRLLDGS